jgi:hypothetical protein
LKGGRSVAIHLRGKNQGVIREVIAGGKMKCCRDTRPEPDASQLPGAVGELPDGDVDAGFVLYHPLRHLQLAGVADGHVVPRRRGSPRRLGGRTPSFAATIVALLVLLPGTLGRVGGRRRQRAEAVLSAGAGATGRGRRRPRERAPADPVRGERRRRGSGGRSLSCRAHLGLRVERFPLQE